MTFVVRPSSNSSAPARLVPIATPSTPVDDSASERAAPLTETLPEMWPLGESISNKPALCPPASAQIIPFGWGAVAARMRFGARTTCSGTTLAEVCELEVPLPPQAASMSAADMSPMTTAVRRAAPVIACFLPLTAHLPGGCACGLHRTAGYV